LPNVTASIPDGTTITGPVGWDGIITPPVVSTSSGDAPAGFSVGDVVISVGSSDGSLTFSNPVTLLLSGVIGAVGYKPSGLDTWYEITNVCADPYLTPGNPPAGSECKISNGADTKILTYHFTSFGGLDPIPTPPRGNSGRPATPATPATSAVPGVSPAVPATPAVPAVGKVLGAEKFVFTKLMRNGSRGNEVMELQTLLTSLGYNLGKVDGRFGPKSRAALIKFQLANGLKGDGIAGPITRAALNK
jgi:hypothetical protein